MSLLLLLSLLSLLLSLFFFPLSNTEMLGSPTKLCTSRSHGLDLAGKKEEERETKERLIGGEEGGDG